MVRKAECRSPLLSHRVAQHDRGDDCDSLAVGPFAGADIRCPSRTPLRGTESGVPGDFAVKMLPRHIPTRRSSVRNISSNLQSEPNPWTISTNSNGPP